MAVRYELSVGLNKGHKTSKIKNVKYTGDKKVKGLRASRMKGVSETHPIIVSVWRNCDFREASTCLCGSAIVITMFTAHNVNHNLVDYNKMFHEYSSFSHKSFQNTMMRI